MLNDSEDKDELISCPRHDKVNGADHDGSSLIKKWFLFFFSAFGLGEIILLRPNV